MSACPVFVPFLNPLTHTHAHSALIAHKSFEDSSLQRREFLPPTEHVLKLSILNLLSRLIAIFISFHIYSEIFSSIHSTMLQNQSHILTAVLRGLSPHFFSLYLFLSATLISNYLLCRLLTILPTISMASEIPEG